MPGAAPRSLRDAPRLDPRSDEGTEERPVLAFDTSGPWIAAALLAQGRVLHRLEPMPTGQAEALIPLLEGLLAEAGLDWPDLHRIGVGTGPGNFTGIRISVAAARGLALGLNIPVLGVTSLEAHALNAPRPCRVRLDARRGEVYVQDFAPDSPARLTADPGPWSGAQVTPDTAAMPLAEAIARIAASRSPGPRPAPFYLRGPDAALPSDPPPVILDA